MIVLRYITIILDVLFLFLLSLFIRDLHWSDAEERGSIIGFGYMMVTLFLNIVLIALL